MDRYRIALAALFQPEALLTHEQMIAIKESVDRGGVQSYAIAMFRPQEPVSRAQAALVLWKMGAHTDHIANPTPDEAPRSAADALTPSSPTPTPTP